MPLPTQIDLGEDPLMDRHASGRTPAMAAVVLVWSQPWSSDEG